MAILSTPLTQSDLPVIDRSVDDENRGFLKIIDDLGPRQAEPTHRMGGRLLQLLFTLCYTREGTGLLASLSVQRGVSEDHIRKGLSEFFTAHSFNLDPKVESALIEAHL